MRASLTRLKNAIWATNMEDEATAPSASTRRPTPSNHSGTSPPLPPPTARSKPTSPIASSPCTNRACAALRKMVIGVAPSRKNRETIAWEAMLIGSSIVESSASCSLRTPLRCSSSGSSTSKTANGAPRVRSTTPRERTAGKPSTLAISPYVSTRWLATLPGGRVYSSFRAIVATAAIEPRKSQPHMRMKPPRVVTPFECNRMKPT
mmetsp:Transcript_33167/g.87153  ORF Transcript_33167/g.87153 Transcript_33167/m.87153 type:complete len:206 (-) Transcript_33167:96-713(-)